MAGVRVARSFVCPGCGYDVTQTIADGIGVCPECGRGVNERICTLMPRGVHLALRASVLAPSVAFLASLPLKNVVSRAIGPSVSGSMPVVCSFAVLLLLYFVSRATYARFDPRDAKIRALQLTIAAVVTSVVLGLLAVVLIGFLAGLVLNAFA